jgi:hypothetical protein
MEDSQVKSRRSDHEIFQRLFQWIDKLQNKGLYPQGLQEQVEVIEKMIEQYGDQYLYGAVIRRLTFWYSLVEQSESQQTIDAFRFNAQLVITLLASREGTNDTNYILRRLERIEPAPPHIWKPSEERELIDEDTKSRIVEWIQCTSGEVVFRYETRRFLRKLLETPNVLDVARHNPEEFASFRAEVERQSKRDQADELTVDSDFLPEPISIDRGSRDDAERIKLMRSAKYIWTIEIRLLGETCSLARLGHTLWSFGEALETIPGVVTEVTAVGTGSIWAKIRAGFQNIWQRDEVIEVLDKGRDAAIAHYLGKPIAETARLEEEASKLREETRNIAKITAAMPDGEHAERIRKEELRHKELENIRTEEEIRRMQLESGIRALEGVRLASDLIAQGIVHADQVQIDINELMYLLIHEDTVQKGHSLKRIGDREIIGHRRDEKAEADKRESEGA